MIKKKIGNRDEDVAGLDISSLIDVSFLLLIYFLVTSTLDPREGDLVDVINCLAEVEITDVILLGFEE